MAAFLLLARAVGLTYSTYRLQQQGRNQRHIPLEHGIPQMQHKGLATGWLHCPASPVKMHLKQAPWYVNSKLSSQQRQSCFPGSIRQCRTIASSLCVLDIGLSRKSRMQRASYKYPPIHQCQRYPESSHFKSNKGDISCSQTINSINKGKQYHGQPIHDATPLTDQPDRHDRVLHPDHLQHLLPGIYFLYAVICAFLTCRTIEGNFDALPTRETFLAGLRRPDPTELPLDQRDCSICYGPLDPAVQFPCKHIFCGECVERLLSPESHDYRCPFCRRPLFRMAAPWDRVTVKLFICTLVISLIDDFLVVGYIIYIFNGLQYRWWNLVDIVASLWKLYRDVQELGLIFESLDHNGLMVWEAFGSQWFWSLVPLQVWRLVAFPGSVQEAVADRIAGMRWA